jgi:hypothetical protein
MAEKWKEKQSTERGPEQKEPLRVKCEISLKNSCVGMM